MCQQTEFSLSAKEGLSFAMRVQLCLPSGLAHGRHNLELAGSIPGPPQHLLGVLIRNACLHSRRDFFRPPKTPPSFGGWALTFDRAAGGCGEPALGRSGC